MRRLFAALLPATALLAVGLALPAVPEFVDSPTAPPLIFTPDWVTLFVPLAVAALVLAGVAGLSARRLVAGAGSALRPERVRPGLVVPLSAGVGAFRDA